MTLAPNEIARRTLDGVAYCHEPRRLTLVLPGAVARDGHEIAARCGFSVRLVDRAPDRELFSEQLLAGNEVVTLDTVRQRLAGDLSAALNAFASQHDASACLTQRAAINELLLARANEIGFACGLEFIAPADVTVESPTLDAQRRADLIAKQQVDRLDRAAEALAKMKSHGSIGSLRPDEQASVLQLLLRDAPARKAIIVAGKSLIEYAPTTGESQSIEIPSELGPLRSARRVTIDGTPRTLVGGRCGVAVLIDDAQSALYLADTTSDRGFNSVTLDPVTGILAAAHGELGIARWDAESAQPLAPVETNGQPRFLTRIDERLLVVIDSALGVIDGTSLRLLANGEGKIIGLVELDDSIVLVRETGAIERLDRSTLEVAHRFHRSTRILSAARLRADGLDALVLAPESGPVDVVSMSGAPLLELHGPQRGLRMLSVCGGCAVGVSADRQQLIVWDLQRTDAPSRTLNLTARHGHRAVDISCGL